jgi:hypothetical protein
MKSKVIKRLFLSAVLLTAMGLSPKAQAAGNQDIAYSAARLATTGTFLSYPSVVWSSFNGGAGAVGGYDGYVYYALIYLGLANYSAELYESTGEHYFAYFKYLGVVDAVQKSSNTGFNSYYSPTAVSYGDYYSDYATAVANSYFAGSQTYQNYAGVGANIYRTYRNSGLYAGGNTSTGGNPWNFQALVPSYSANIAQSSYPTAYWELGQYYSTTYEQTYGVSLYLNAANYAWGAGSPYNQNAARCFYTAYIGRYFSASYAYTGQSLSFLYWYVAALYSGYSNEAYENVAYSYLVSYLTAANSSFTTYGNWSQQYFNAAGVTLR